MDLSIVVEAARHLANRGLTIAFAESATAGRLMAEFSLTPSAGKILKGGVVCYDACLKEDILGVSPKLIQEYTPESAEVTEALARCLKDLIPSDVQLAVTGLPRSGGSETPQKPVGTMFVHFLMPGKSIGIKERFSGSAEEIIEQTVQLVAQLILTHLL